MVLPVDYYEFLNGWSLRLTEIANDFSQWLHEKFFSPEWVIWCFLRSCLSVKDLEHVLHSNAFCSLWIFSCLERLPDCVKVFAHISHVNGLWLVWTIKCVFRRCAFLNDLLHMLQSNGLSLLLAASLMCNLPFSWSTFLTWNMITLPYIGTDWFLNRLWFCFRLTHRK